MECTFNSNGGNVSVFDKPKNHYNLTHAVFAVFAFVLGMIWYRWIGMNSVDALYDGYNGMWITLFTALFAVFVSAFFYCRKINIGSDSLFMLVFSLIISIRFSIYYRDAGSEIFLLAMMMLHITVLISLRCAGSKTSLDSIVGETGYAVIVDPFISFQTLFAAMSGFYKKKDDGEANLESVKKAGKKAGLVAAGLFVSVPILMIVFALLSSDSWFVGLIEIIDEFFSQSNYDFNLFEFVNPATILVSMYIYGALFTADKRQTEEKKTPMNLNVVPATIIKTVLVSLLAVYLLYAVSQITGFCIIITGKLPEGMTYASFARSGFFELCIVACINGAVLFYSSILLSFKDGEKQGTWLKYLLTGFTLFLVVTAASKMCLYISAYGLTPKRFYTLWFMALLAVIFVMTLFKLKNNAFKLSRYSVYVSCAFLIVLFMIDFRWLSEYINSRYFAGGFNV